MTHPVNLTDLLQAIGHGNLNFQHLDNCLESIKAKQGVTMVTFGTHAITPGSAATSCDPHGIIIWVDRDLYQQRFQALQRGEGQTYGQLQVQLNEALSLLREAQRYVQYRLDYTECDARIVMGLIYDIESALAGKLSAPMAVTETIRTAPERIWLQVGDEAHYSSEPFPSNTESVTWCRDSVTGCEVPYVRADLLATSFLFDPMTAAETIHPDRNEIIELIDVLKNTHAASLTNLDMLASAILAAGFKRGAA